ncbi:MAG: hypothetical protein WBD20_03595 [Pirellulaceae bacterium]
MNRVLLASLLVVVLLLHASEVVKAETIQYSFGGSSRSEKGFDFASLENFATGKSVRGGGFKVTHVDQKTPLASVGGKTRFGLRGDFEIELSFRVDTLEIPTAGNGSGIMLRLEFADRDQSGLTVALNASPNELLFWQIDNTTYGQQEHQVDKRPAFTNIFESPQTIRVKRVGDKIIAKVGATGASIEFNSLEETDADVSAVAMWMNTGGEPADLAIELNELKIEADELANDISAPSGVSSWTMVFWAFAVMLGLAGIYWFWQTLRPENAS